MAQFLRRQVVLENTKLGHNKCYEMNIYEQDQTDIYTLRCRWGRIEHFKNGNPQSQVKAKDTTWTNAQANLVDIRHAKLKKGYKVIKDHGKGSSKDLEITTYHSKSIAKRVEIQKAAEIPVFDRTEHIEVPQSDWWNSAPVDIEERAV